MPAYVGISCKNALSSATKPATRNTHTNASERTARFAETPAAASDPPSFASAVAVSSSPAPYASRGSAGLYFITNNENGSTSAAAITASTAYVGLQPNDWMSAPPSGFITAPPMPEQAMAMPIARPAFFLNQLPIMIGAGSRNANAEAVPSTAPATYHCHSAWNWPIAANARAATTMPTLTSTRMLTFDSNLPATGSAAVMHRP